MTTGRKLVWTKDGDVWKAGPFEVSNYQKPVGPARRRPYWGLCVDGTHGVTFLDQPTFQNTRAAAQRIADAVLANVGVKP